MMFSFKTQQQTQYYKHLNSILIFSKMKILSHSRQILFFLDSIKFLGHQIQNNHIHPLKSKTDGFLKLQPHKNKKETQNYVGFLTFISKHIYNLQVNLRFFLSPTPGYNRFQMDTRTTTNVR